MLFAHSIKRPLVVISAILSCLLFTACGFGQPVAEVASSSTPAPESAIAESVTSPSEEPTSVSTAPPPPPVDVCQNIEGMQVSPPPGTQPGLSDDGVHDDCRSAEEWQSIYDAKAKAAVDAQFAQLDAELNGLVEQLQGMVPADEKWDTSIYLNAAVKFACSNQDRPGAGEKASFLYDASWANWTPKAGEHLYQTSFYDELGSYGCKTTPVSKLFPSSPAGVNHR